MKDKAILAVNIFWLASRLCAQAHKDWEECWQELKEAIKKEGKK